MKERIDFKEFFAMLYIYILANDLIRGFYARELGHDVWVPTAIGIFGSMLIFTCYFIIYKNNNFANFSDSVRNILGKYLSKIILIFYALYFILSAYLNAYDYIEMAKIFLLKEMPIFVFAFVCLYVNFHVVRHGIEVIGRVIFSVFFPIILFFIICITLLLVINGPQLDNILPILEDGIKPIIKPSFYMSYSIPFGELFALFIIFQYVKNKKEKYKKSVWAILMAGFALITVTFLKIFLLGPDILATEVSPSIGLSHLFDYSNIIQRFDIVVVTFLSLYSFAKVTILVYVGKHLIMCAFPGDDSNAQSRVKDAIVNGVICFSIAIAIIFLRTNYLYFLTTRFKIIVPYISLTFELIIPFLLIVLSFIRKPKNILTNPDFNI